MKIRLIDLVTPKRWLSVIVWVLKMLVKKLDKSEVYLEAWEIEQYQFRLLTCPECVAQGKCTHCGCDTIGRMMNRFENCSAGKWGSFFESKELWEAHKKEQNLNFFMVGKYTSQEELRRIKNILNNYLI